jgi:hypothetical protein
MSQLVTELFSSCFLPDSSQMRSLPLSRADCRTTSARRRKTAHPTVMGKVLFSGHGASKTLSGILIMKGIWIPCQL